MPMGGRGIGLCVADDSAVVLMGPEEPLEKLEEQLRGIDWDGTGVGYGVRGARLPELTVRFEGETCVDASACQRR